MTIDKVVASITKNDDETHVLNILNLLEYPTNAKTIKDCVAEIQHQNQKD